MKRGGLLVRGTPIERYLTERFLRLHTGDIRGLVLELDEAPLAESVGEPVHVDRVSDNPDSDTVTILADLSDDGALPRATYDCVVAGPTWTRVGDVEVALSNLWNSVRTGGTLLVAVPAVPDVDPSVGRSFNRSEFQEILSEQVDADFRAEGFGNSATATASRLGFVAEDVRREDRLWDDRTQPSLLGARVWRNP